MHEDIVIASNIEDANFLIKNKTSFSSVFALTPNVYSLLINKNISLFDHKKIDYDKIHKDTVIKVNYIDNEICKIINKIKITDSSKEYIKFQINVFMSSYIFLFLLISNFNKIEIVNKKKLTIFTDHNKLINILFKKFFQNKSFNHFFPIYNDYNNNNKFFINLSNYLCKFFIKNKKIIFSSGDEYGMEKLNNQFLNHYNKCVIIKIVNFNKRYYLTILKNIISFLSSKKKYDIFTSNLKKDKYFDKVEVIFKNINNEYLFLAKNSLQNILIDGVSYIENSNQYLRGFLKDINIEFYLAHQIKMANSLIMAENAKIKNANIFLLSHGVHSYSNNEISNISLNFNAKGMLHSKYSKYSICQSKISYNAIKKLNSNKKIIKTFPLMWGKKKFTNNDHIKYIKRSKKIILHASTFKSYFVRPLIYESPFEYIIGINKLIDAIKYIEDVEFIVRVRPTPECTYETLIKLLTKSDNVIIKKDGSFMDDLRKSTLLISFSSTTIEEALYEKIPVAIHGYSNRFNHFESYSNNVDGRSAIYNLNNSNLTGNIKKILDAHYNKPLNTDELNDFIWSENDIDLKSIENLFNYK